MCKQQVGCAPGSQCSHCSAPLSSSPAPAARVCNCGFTHIYLHISTGSSAPVALLLLLQLLLSVWCAYTSWKLTNAACDSSFVTLETHLIFSIYSFVEYKWFYVRLIFVQLECWNLLWLEKLNVRFYIFIFLVCSFVFYCGLFSVFYFNTDLL